MHSWATALSTWFAVHQRAMPWRETPSPYRTWISEMMLQQTQVDTVIPYFARFLARFPDVHTLAAAHQDDVLKQWEGLGYYSRARNLHKAAKQLVDIHAGVLPDDYKTLQTLPGVGPYAAAAIASIAYEVPVPVVDGNVLRVFARFWGLDTDIRLPSIRQDIFDRLTPVVTTQTPSVFNQAIMELGALICTPKKPQCTRCPIQSDCVAYATDQVDTLPIKSKAQPVPHYVIGVGLIRYQGRMLIAKRKESGMLGGLWELPGGKQNSDEAIETTVTREILEETGLSVTIVKPLCMIKHAYTHFKITMHTYLCDAPHDRAIAKSSTEVRWVLPSELSDYAFPTATHKVFEAVGELSQTVDIPPSKGGIDCGITENWEYPRGTLPA
jgi:A/G-specific adenine glycosylase